MPDTPACGKQILEKGHAVCGIFCKRPEGHDGWCVPFADGAWGDLDPHGVLPLPQTGIKDNAGILGPGSPYVVPASEDVEATARQRFAESVLNPPEPQPIRHAHPGGNT